MRKTPFVIASLLACAAIAADGPVDRWAKAAGGREKLAAIKAIYREGTIQYGGFEGTIKVWHTAEGRYRKEEQVATFSSIETFDGTTATVQRGPMTRKLEGAELGLAASKAFANSNAMFFVFFPGKHRGSVATE